MPAPAHKAVLCLLLLLSLAAATLRGQRAHGELRIEVRDSQGASLPADGELLSEANQVHRTFQVALDGRYTAQDLPFGIYRLTIRAEGFASWTNLVELRSEVPLRVPVTLALRPSPRKFRSPTTPPSWIPVAPARFIPSAARPSTRKWLRSRAGISATS